MGYLVAIAAIILIAVVVLSRWEGGGLSVAMFSLIDKGIQDVQGRAARKIFPQGNPGAVSGFNERAMNDLTVTVNDIIRFVYTVERCEQGLLHTLSSQLTRPKQKKYHVQCMLAALLVLNRELGEAGIRQEDVKFEIFESELGTQYVQMVLSPEQHARMAENTWGLQQGHGG